MTGAEITAHSRVRGEMYHFLAGLYLLEVDAAQLQALKAMAFPALTPADEADRALADGYTRMAAFLREMTEERLDELAADYARIFLAAGSAAGNAAHPYAGVYRDARTGGNAAWEMETLYLARGLEPDPDSYRTMHDHVGLMLEYMSVLCAELTDAVSAGETEKAGALCREQGMFLRDRLCSWVFGFTEDIRKYASLPFYPALASVTEGFLRKENALFQEA